MTSLPSLPVRLGGLAALLAGAIFILIQPFHPLDRIESLGTTAMTVTQSFKFVMSVLFLLGVTGLYAHQRKQSGWPGFVGFVLLFASWALQAVFVFANAFVVPQVALVAPEFATSWLGIINGDAATVDLGVLPTLYSLAGGLYLLGGLVFGLASLRAKVFGRWPSLLLMAGAILPVAIGSFIGHPLDRLLAVPVGLALAWLGWELLGD